MIQEAALCVLVRREQVLLGERLRGELKGLITPYSTTCERGEGHEDAAKRVVKLATGIDVWALEDMGVLHTSFVNSKHYELQVYRTQVHEEPLDSPLWKNRWYFVNGLPTKRMLASDVLWLERVALGEPVSGYSKCHKMDGKYELVQPHKIFIGGKKIK